MTDWKGNSYDSILIIINWFKKIVHYKPIKVTINTPSLVEVIIDIVVRVLWPLRLDYYQPRIAFNIKVLVIAMLFPRHQVEANNCLLFAKEQPN